MGPLVAQKKTTRRAPKEPAATKPTAKRAKRAPPAAEREEAPAPKPQPKKAPVERTRVIFPREVYEARKEEIKAPLKDLDLKWQYLGPGKGRYHKEGVSVFVQHSEAGADFTYWGEDAAALAAIGRAWEGIPTASTAKVEAAEKAAEVSEAYKLWKLAEPQRRPGEPEGFFKRRHDEWKSKEPGTGA